MIAMDILAHAYYGRCRILTKICFRKGIIKLETETPAAEAPGVEVPADNTIRDDGGLAAFSEDKWSEAQFKKCIIKKLREELKFRNSKISGKKNDIINRLLYPINEKSSLYKKERNKRRS